MPNGTVKWFNDAKGWGLIRQNGLAEDVFVHHEAIQMKGHRYLVEGDAVEYLVKKDHKGVRALNVSGPDRNPVSRQEFIVCQSLPTAKPILDKLESPGSLKARCEAAALGCMLCAGAIKIPPAGPPFQAGQWIGRYLCASCWVLYWSEHPEDLADNESREYIREEARQVRLKRGAEILFEEGANRIYLSSRGTLLLDLHSSVGTAPNEFDPEQFQFLVKAIKAVSCKLPAYQANLTA